MRLLWGSKDGGPESRVRMWGFESKRFGSLLLLRFEEGTRESFHTHAFNSWSWVLRGSLVEQTLQEKGPSWTPERTTWAGFGPSWRPIHTDRRRFHRVAGGRQGAWVFTMRGPWWEGWREYNPATGEQLKLTHGRISRAPLEEEKAELSQTGSFPLMSTACSTCRRRPAVCIKAIPQMQSSEAFCDTCVGRDAIPWETCVANTACLGGRLHTDAEWQRICAATACLNRKSIEQFDQQVKECQLEMQAAMEAGDVTCELSDSE